MRATTLLLVWLLHLVNQSQAGPTVYQVGGACYVSTSSDNSTLYVTRRIGGDEVFELNSILEVDCPASNTWLVLKERPNLPTLENYLASFTTRNTNAAVGSLPRLRRSSSRFRQQRHSPRLRSYKRASLRTGRTNRQQLADSPYSSVQQLADSPYSSVQQLADNPYSSVVNTIARGSRNRFKHYNDFFDEVTPNATRRPQVAAPRNNQRVFHIPQYDLKLDDNSNKRSPDYKILQTSTNDRLSRYNHLTNPINAMELSENVSSYEKRHTNSIGRHGVFDDQLYQDDGSKHIIRQNENNNQAISIPDTIIKDGQVFYRHDASSDPILELNKNEYSDVPNSSKINTGDLENDTNSLIFSQALGSSGNEGSFRAEAEGRGQNGQVTHSLVDGDHSRASASASAIRIDQQALAHVSVYPRTTSSGQMNPIENESISPLQTVPSSEIEDMMRRNGLTGFAMATVTARKKGSPRISSGLGSILPGFSTSSNIGANSKPVPEFTEDKETHKMLDDIVETVYSPLEEGRIFIDHGGLDGGAGDHHHESEFQQVNNEELLEGGDKNIHNENLVGLATYNQGSPGYPPYDVGDYSDMYDNFDRYNFNQPIYFPTADYDEIDGLEISQSLDDSHVLPVHIPTELQTGVHYPIVKGDVPAANNEHMIVDDTLSSYFPPPRMASVIDDSRLRDSSINDVNMPLNSTSVGSHSSINDVNMPLYRTSVGSHSSVNDVSHDVNLPINTTSVVSMSKTDMNRPFLPIYENTLFIPPTDNFNNSYLDKSLYNTDVLINHEEILSNNIITQPAYNSHHEYVKSKINESRLTALNNANNSSNDVQPEKDKYDVNNDLENIHSNYYGLGIRHDDKSENSSSSKNTAISDVTSSQFDPNYNNNENYDQIHNDYYSGSGYDSSYETSSQSTSQSVYTSSHHFSYQHGSDDRGIGNTIDTHLGQQPHKSEQTRPTQFVPTSDTQNYPYYIQPESTQPHSLQSHSKPAERPSGSEEIQTMRILTPRRPGSMFTLPSSNSGISEVKIVMAESPSQDRLLNNANKILQPGDKIPATHGYVIPPGFRGRLILNSFGTMSRSLPSTTMHYSQRLPTRYSNGNSVQRSLRSSSVASSAGSGTSLASGASAQMVNRGTVSTKSLSSSNGINRNRPMSEPRPSVYSYQQTFQANPMNRFKQQSHQRPRYQMQRQPEYSTMPGMRSRSWSNWMSNSWHSGNRGSDGGQVTGQSSYTPPVDDCGYWSMNCFMAHNSFNQNEICRPNHIKLSC